jgi:hypothetical protein
MNYRQLTLDERYQVQTLRALACARRLAIAALLLLCVCGKETSASSAEFHGVQYEAPAGTHARVADGVLPGPGGGGGIPSGVRISLTLTHRDPRGFYVEIVKTAAPRSLDAEKATLLANKVGSNMVGKVTPTGWELTYDMPVTNDARIASQSHVLYADLAGGHYTCSYADVNCTDRAAAEAICRSMRPKPAAK